MSGAATAMTAPPRRSLAANSRALLALRESASPLNDVLRLDVVAGVALRLVVVAVHRLLRMPRAFLRHHLPPLFAEDDRGAYIGIAGVVA